MDPAVDAARAFAHALDASDWSAAKACLSPSCEYAFRGGELQGPDRIIETYRTIGEWVAKTFDSVRYESSVESSGAKQATISFQDRIAHQGHHLDFRCYQVITVDDAGTICHILHVDLAGEPEKVERFNAACGVQKPSI